MEVSAWQRVRQLFEAAAALPIAERGAYLDQACEDAAVRAEVESLLAADDRADAATQSLGRIAPDLIGALDDARQEEERDRWIGTRLGAWKLVREIGRGGMGAVYLAERDDGNYWQRAAIKLIRPGWDSGDVLRRFSAERQILAALNHPNIARLMDGGASDEGKPYLVLEYVEGEHLVTHCDRMRLPLRERLRLFLDVCRPVAFAHRCLIVHRDIKPSNVMVDSSGQVKLLDFGIAKLLDAGTAISGVRSFTPEYAAPEQVRGEAVTTGVDVYALGLMLYELLTGRRAHDVSGSTPAAYEQAILTQEPQRPSLAAMRSDSDAAQLAHMRVQDMASLSAHLRGDLDAIVLKALRKEPMHRYASVEDLAADVERHLARRPVTARRGNWRYVAGRFLRRNALASVLAGVAVVGVAGGFAVALWQADVARRQRDAAESAAQTSSAVASFMSKIFANADPSTTDGRDPSASTLLEAGVREIELATDVPATERSAMYFALGTAQLAREAPELGLQLMQRAVELAGSDPVARFNALHGLGRAYANQAEPHTAEATYEQARRWLEQHPELSSYIDKLDYSQAATRITLNRRPEAVAMLRAVRDRLQARGELLSDLGVESTTMLVYAFTFNKRHDEALALSQKMHEAMLAEPSASLSKRSIIVGSRAFALMEAKRYAQAEPLFRESLALDEQIYGKGHLQTVVSLNNLGVNLMRHKRFDEAAVQLQQALAIRRNKLKPGHPAIGALLLVLADIYSSAGKHELALAHFDECLKVYRDAGMGDEINALRASYKRAYTLATLGQFQAALDGYAPVLPKLMASGYYNGAGFNPLKLFDAELHQRLGIDDRACRLRADLVKPTAGDLARLDALEANCPR